MAERQAPEEIQEQLDFGPSRPGVRAPLSGEMKTLLEVLARAFFDDPVAIFLFPNERDRRLRYARLCQLAIDGFGPSGIVLTDDAVRGAAIWQRPSPRPAPLLTRARLLLRILAVTGSRFLRAGRLDETMSRRHPEAPHYYLAILGTDPDEQGRGIGSALLQPILARCDQERVPAYLESSKESNLPFYERHGFRVVEELQVPGGPRLWAMERPNA